MIRRENETSLTVIERQYAPLKKLFAFFLFPSLISLLMFSCFPNFIIEFSELKLDTFFFFLIASMLSFLVLFVSFLSLIWIWVFHSFLSVFDN